VGPKLMIQDPDPEVLASRLRHDLLSCLEDDDLLCIPTGRSPLELYRQIREDTATSQRWRSFRYLQLDEYLDPSGTIHSFREELHQQFFGPLQIPEDQICSIDPQGDPDTQALELDQRYERWGPPKACVLGLGANGHIAFNEPGSSFSGYTVVDLATETIRANFPPPQPDKLQALTISLEQICKSQHIFLLVPQAEKGPVLDRCLAGPKDAQLPASWLYDHPSLHVYRH